MGIVILAGMQQRVIAITIDEVLLLGLTEPIQPVYELRARLGVDLSCR
jgi:hypothetical protein